MSSVNSVHLIGRLGKDPEVRSMANGAKVANFTIATDESWKDKSTGEKKTETTWHSIVAWRGPAEIVEKYLHKGDQVYVQGRIKTRSWEKDGVTRYTTEILVDNLTLLGGKNGARGSEPGETSESYAGGTSSGSSTDTDDLPF